MAYAQSIEDACTMTQENPGGHVHRCVFAAEHTDWEYDGSHQCDCDEIF